MTRLDAALAGVTRIGFDTAPFIYFIERNPVYIALVREIIRRVDAGVFTGAGCTVTLTEVLVHPKRRGDAGVVREYRNLLLFGRNFTLLPVDVSVAERAADRRAAYNLRTPDALQLAAALEAGCDAFLTNDRGLRRVREVPVLALDELSLVGSTARRGTEFCLPVALWRWVRDDDEGAGEGEQAALRVEGAHHSRAVWHNGTEVKYCASHSRDL